MVITAKRGSWDLSGSSPPLIRAGGTLAHLHDVTYSSINWSGCLKIWQNLHDEEIPSSITLTAKLHSSVNINCIWLLFNLSSNRLRAKRGALVKGKWKSSLPSICAQRFLTMPCARPNYPLPLPISLLFVMQCFICSFDQEAVSPRELRSFVMRFLFITCL